MHDIIETPLWTRARAMFARAVAMIGDAAAIAAVKFMPKTLRRGIIAWLAPLEHIVRKLLLAEAATLRRAERARTASGMRVVQVPLRGMAQTWQAGSAPPPAALRANARDIEAAARKARPEAARSNLDASRPETWRAQFSLALPRDQRVANAHAPRIRALWGAYAPPAPEPTRTPRILNDEDTPLRLARRFEALRRVLENPKPHAERLARALAREVTRCSDIARRYFFAGCATDDYDRDDPRLSIDALSYAFEAPSAFGDTS